MAQDDIKPAAAEENQPQAGFSIEKFT